MAFEAGLPTIAVVICAYTEERWDETLGAIASVHGQSITPQQVIVVVDHNADLYKRLTSTVANAVVVENTGPRGLSGARNTGVSMAATDVVAFLDDDAEAAPDWLARLVTFYDDPDVLGVGGKVVPVWEAGRPGHFAEELDWIVGCTHRGMPKVATQVRNLIGANMSFRREVVERVGFNTDLGRIGSLPVGCEETELCIRATSGSPGSRIVFEPAAVVHHRVPSRRSAIRYMITRSWFEGISKGHVSRLVGRAQALGPEKRYVRKILPRAIMAGARDWALHRDRSGLSRASMILAVVSATAFGYLSSGLQLRRSGARL